MLRQSIVRLFCVPFAFEMFISCVPLPGGRSLAKKAVTGTSGEDMLLASDGDSRRVTAKTFQRARIGDEHLCAWQSSRESGDAPFGDPKRAGSQGPLVRPEFPPSSR